MTTPSKPDEPIILTPIDRHFLPAYHAWLIENGFTPDVVLFRDHPGVQVPARAKGNEVTPVYDPEIGLAEAPLRSIKLNLAYRATSGLSFTDDGIYFSSRFNGKSEPIVIPYGAITYMEARENPRLSHWTPRKIVRVEGSHIYMLSPEEIYNQRGFRLTEMEDQEIKPSKPEPAKRDRSHLSVVKS